MSSQAEKVRASPNPYAKAVALMTWRDISVPMKVTFHFADESTVTFTKAYTVDEEVR